MSFHATLPIGARYFLDSRAREWKAFERQRVRPDGDPVTVLVFESAVSFRCVHSYPVQWADLSDQALEELSWRA
jgi:hypothetical protein